jgi:hypothetical protein
MNSFILEEEKIKEDFPNNKIANNKLRNKIFGRWLENLGIGVCAGITVSLTLISWKYWYFLVIGLFLITWGSC